MQLEITCSWIGFTFKYRKTSNIRRTFVGNKIVDNSDVVGASPVGAAPTTSSFSTLTPGPVFYVQASSELKLWAWWS